MQVIQHMHIKHKMKLPATVNFRKLLFFWGNFILIFLNSSGFTFSQNATNQPVYFHLSHHQEEVGRVQLDFPKYEYFRTCLKTELDLLDQYDVVSDQCFSDFIVSVILYMYNTGRDTNAYDIFTWMNESNQNLGYHFHPSTWDIDIRTDKIKDMDMDEAIIEYTKWEMAYYDWTYCDTLDTDSTAFCGILDTTRLGGIELMKQYFTKPVVNECLTMLNPAAGQVIRNKFGNITPIIGQAGSVHFYYNTNIENLWMSDWMFSSEPDIYIYKMMGNLYIQNLSHAWAEGLMDAGMLEQVLSVLPRDIPHMFAIHLTNSSLGDSSLKQQLDYLTNEFIPDNPGSQFISTASIPDLIVPNSYEFSMNDLENACSYMLNNWHGRPPAIVKYNNKYTSIAAVFKALQSALKSWYVSPEPHSWPAYVAVPEFIWPPLGRQNQLLTDTRLGYGFSFVSMLQAVENLADNDSIPYVINIPYAIPPLRANAAEFLNGMCNLFLRLRQGETTGQLYVLESSIIPISFLPVETAQNQYNITPTNMNWLSGLQLWTTEPQRLKTFDELAIEEHSNKDNDFGFLLNQNYPNPFSENTSIRFYLSKSMEATFNVYDILGKTIITIPCRNYEPGWHTIQLSQSQFSNIDSQASIYFFQMATQYGTKQKKALMLK